MVQYWLIAMEKQPRLPVDCLYISPPQIITGIDFPHKIKINPPMMIVYIPPEYGDLNHTPHDDCVYSP